MGAALAPASSVAATRTLLVLGDSLSAEYGLPRDSGWVKLLRDRLAEKKLDWNVVNASISGETTAGGASRLPKLLDEHKPRLVIVELGANDGLRGSPLDMTRRNLDTIIGASQGAGAKVLLVGMQLPPNFGRGYTERFAAVFEQTAQAHKAALVPFLLDGFAADASFFQADRIHPTVQAQPLILDNVWPKLEPLLRAGH
nr:arylesterase [Derxia gummosa]